MTKFRYVKPAGWDVEREWKFRNYNKPSEGSDYPDGRLKRLVGDLGQNGFTRGTSRQLEASASDDCNECAKSRDKI